MDPIEESSETNDAVHKFPEQSSHPVNRIQVVRRSGRSKNPVIMIVPSFSGNKYDTTVTMVVSGVNFAFPYVHPDNHIRSNQCPYRDHEIHYATTHIYTEVGMKRCRTISVYEVSNKLKQLHFRNTFEPIYPLTLSKE